MGGEGGVQGYSDPPPTRLSIPTGRGRISISLIFFFTPVLVP